MTWVAAGDPGESAAVVACKVPARGRVVLMGVWALWGGTFQARMRRYDTMVRELAAYAPGPTLVGLETSNTTSSRVKGRRTWIGLGTHRGVLLRALYKATGKKPLDLLADAKKGWPLQLSINGRRLSPGKRGDGWHRVLEARQLVAGWDQHVADAPLESDADRSRLIDQSEAALMCALLGQRLRAQKQAHP